MLLTINCHVCQGTGGLYDHALGIDDECVECGGNGFVYIASGTHLEEYPECEKVPEAM